MASSGAPSARSRFLLELLNLLVLQRLVLLRPRAQRVLCRGHQGSCHSSTSATVRPCFAQPPHRCLTPTMLQHSAPPLRPLTSSGTSASRSAPSGPGPGRLGAVNLEGSSATHAFGVRGLAGTTLSNAFLLHVCKDRRITRGIMIAPTRSRHARRLDVTPTTIALRARTDMATAGRVSV